MPQVKIATEELQRLLWPGEHHRVRIIGARHDGQCVVFKVAGEGLPEGEELRPIVTRYEKTKFSAVNPLNPL